MCSSDLTDHETLSRAPRRETHHIERFRYGTGDGAPITERLYGDLHGRSGTDHESSSAHQQAINEARAEGYQQGLADAKEKFDAELRREHLTISRAIEEFAQDRFRYFRRVEKEVVELALSIAKRILHRESQLDPLMLQGAVRGAYQDFLARDRHPLVALVAELASRADSTLIEIKRPGFEVKLAKAGY